MSAGAPNQPMMINQPFIGFYNPICFKANKATELLCFILININVFVRLDASKALIHPALIK